MVVSPCREDQDAYSSISVVPDKEYSNPDCPSQLAFLSLSEVPHLSKSHTCSDTDWHSKNYISMQIESADGNSLCSVHMDTVQENLGAPKTEDTTAHCLVKTESALTRVSRRKISLQIGAKIMQLVPSHILLLLKFTSRDKSMTETAHYTSNSRWRTYKRTASFNSRRVVLLFSILSSMGTMVLIYLTLRVKQIGDGLVRV